MDGSKSSAPPAEHGRRESGFTLLEMLVAFAILAIALTAVFRAFQSGLEHERRAGLAAARVLEARSILEASLAGGPVADTEGMLSTGERWRLEEVPVAPPEQGWVVPAYRLTLTVSNGDGERLRLVTVRLGG